MSTTPTTPTESSSDSGGLTVHRLDLPADVAVLLTAEADANERTIPGQIRFSLRAWLTTNGTAAQGVQ